ncbi:MAG: hypothetical protein ACKVGW_04270, partial [Verrucomicrobiia bacterium]
MIRIVPPLQRFLFLKTFTQSLLFVFGLVGSQTVFGQSALSGTAVEDDADFFVRLDAFVKYGGGIDVFDSLKGRVFQ